MVELFQRRKANNFFPIMWNRNTFFHKQISSRWQHKKYFSYKAKSKFCFRSGRPALKYFFSKKSHSSHIILFIYLHVLHFLHVYVQLCICICTVHLVLFYSVLTSVKTTSVSWTIRYVIRIKFKIRTKRSPLTK
jgi:hypothetical protein